MTNKPRTLFEKIWDRHVVVQEQDAPAILYIDLHLVHEVTSPQAFEGLRQKGLKVRRPDHTGSRAISTLFAGFSSVLMKRRPPSSEAMKNTCGPVSVATK